MGAGAYDASISDDAPTGLPADASSCHPGSVVTFVPNGYRAADVRTGACTDAQISAYFDACFGSHSSSAACSAFGRDASADATCAACILTSDSGSRYGPLVASGALVRANVAGCIELTEPRLLSCAKTVQAESACELAACQANCPVADDDPSSRLAYEGCAAVADTAGCSAYVTAPQCGVEGPDGGVVADGACLPTGLDAGDGSADDAFMAFYYFAVPLFCGATAGTGEPADATTDHGSSSGVPSVDASLADASLADASLADASLADASLADASLRAPPGDASSADASSIGDGASGHDAPSEPNDAKAPVDGTDGIAAAPSDAGPG